MEFNSNLSAGIATGVERDPQCFPESVDQILFQNETSSKYCSRVVPIDLSGLWANG